MRPLQTTLKKDRKQGYKRDTNKIQQDPQERRDHSRAWGQSRPSSEGCLSMGINAQSSKVHLGFHGHCHLLRYNPPLSQPWTET